MKKMKNKNTLKKGSASIVVFREGSEWYAAVLEFNIVESGSTPQEAMLLAFEAVMGYVESAKKIKARPHILNQVADKEYDKMWHTVTETRRQNSNVFFAGKINIGNGRALIPT